MGVKVRESTVTYLYLYKAAPLLLPVPGLSPSSFVQHPKWFSIQIPAHSRRTENVSVSVLTTPRPPASAQGGTQKQLNKHYVYMNGLLQWLGGKESTCQHRICGFSPWVGKIPWRRAGQPTPLFLPGDSHGQRSLCADYSPWGHKESDTISD